MQDLNTLRIQVIVAGLRWAAGELLKVPAKNVKMASLWSVGSPAVILAS